MTTNEQTATEPVGSVISAAWAIKRALLGLGILTIGIGTVAWLLWSTIEADPAEAASAPGATVVQQSATPSPTR